MKKLGAGQKALIAVVAVVAAGGLAFGITNAVAVQQDKDKAVQCAIGNC